MAKIPRRLGPTTESGGGPSAGGAGAGRAMGGAMRPMQQSPRSVSQQNAAARTYIEKGPKSPARVENGKAAMARVANKGTAKGIVGGAVLGAGAQRALDKKVSPNAKKPKK